jgi:CheY-like chemotaxis protein
MKILIIEDEILIQLSLKTFLTRRGHTVKATASGMTAISMLKEESFDKIICDLMLNDITGFDVIEECTNLFGADRVKAIIVIITAYNNDQILNQAKGYAVPIFIKPFDNLDGLCNEIERNQTFINH